ncbi:hypothetical protein [Microvirga pakistanensis]
MHGGAAGSGAPHGNQNALQTGLHTRAMIAQRQAVSTLLKRARQVLDDLE